MSESKKINNTEIKRLIEIEISKLRRKLRNEEKIISPFRTFCYYDDEKSLMAVAQKVFEKGFKTSGYSISDNSYNHPDFEIVLNGKCTKNSIEAVYNEIINDNRIFDYIKKEIIQKLIESNKVFSKKFKLSKNAGSFMKLIENLYEECSNLNRIRYSLPSTAEKEKRELFLTECELCDAIRLIEEQIGYKFGELYTTIDEFKIVINFLENLIQFIDGNKDISINQEKINLLYKIIKPDKILSSYFAYLEELSKKETEKLDEERRSSDTYIKIFDPIYVDVIKEQIKLLSDQITECNNFLNSFAIVSNNANIDDENTIEIIKKSILDSKTNNTLSESLKIILNMMNATNPRRSNFDKLLELKYIKLTPITRRMIPNSYTLDNIIEIFDCYREFLDDRNTKQSVKRIINIIIEEIAVKIIGLAKIIKQKNYCYTINKYTYDKMIEGIIKRKIIEVTPEEKSEFLKVNKEMYSDAPLDAKNYFIDIVSDIDEYNDNMLGRVARKKAKTIKTKTLNKYTNEGLEEASAFLSQNISKINDELVLKMLEYFLDEEVDVVLKDSKTEREEFYDLCSLSVDCSRYNRAKDTFYDKEEIEKIIMAIK